MEAQGIDNRANNQSATVIKTLEPTLGEKSSEKTPDLDNDRILIEQQALLARIKRDGLDNKVIKEIIAELPPPRHQILLLGKARSTRRKIQPVKEFSQDIRTLERNHQNKRRIEM